MKSKIDYKGELSLYPCPTVLVTSKWKAYENVLTISWAGIASSHPEYITIAINKKRYSYDLVKESLKFCVNIPDMDIVKKVDYCGSHSGKDVDKFAMCGFQKEYYRNEYISLTCCPISLMCEVENIYPLGSHDLFIGRVVKKMINPLVEDSHKQLKPIVYFRPYYYQLKDSEIGYYGYSKDEIKK